jgi:hypothetical protein
MRNSKSKSSLGILIILAVAGLILVGFFALTTGDAHAEGGKGPNTKKVNVILTLDMQPEGVVGMSSQLLTQKGPMDCVRCGAIVPTFGTDDKIKSVHIRLAPHERIVTATYNYTSFDGSGHYEGMTSWNGSGMLPAQKWSTDAQGVSHQLFITSVSAQVFNKKPYSRRRSLKPPPHDTNTGVCDPKVFADCGGTK